MNCHAARDLFTARLDDALSAAEQVELDAHLATCPECRREQARFGGTVGLLRAAAPVRAPAGFVDRVLAAARPAIPWYRRLGRRLFWPVEVKLPLEAAAVVLVAVLAGYLYERSPELGLPAQKEPVATRAPDAPAERPAAAPPPAARRAEAPSKEPARPYAVTEPERLLDRPQSQESAQLESKAREAEKKRESAPGTPAPPAPAPPPVAAPRGALEAPEPAHSGARQDAAAQNRDAGVEAARDRLAAAAKTGAVAALSGRLAVSDRDAADRGLAALLQQIGGREVARRTEADAVVVEVILPGTAYAALVDGLARIGRWQLEQPPPEPAPATVRVTVRIIG